MPFGDCDWRALLSSSFRTQASSDSSQPGPSTEFPASKRRCFIQWHALSRAASIPGHHIRVSKGPCPVVSKKIQGAQQLWSFLSEWLKLLHDCPDLLSQTTPAKSPGCQSDFQSVSLGPPTDSNPEGSCNKWFSYNSKNLYLPPVPLYSKASVKKKGVGIGRKSCTNER